MSLYVTDYDSTYAGRVHKVLSFAPETEDQCANLRLYFRVKTVCGLAIDDVREILCEARGKVCHECFPSVIK